MGAKKRVCNHIGGEFFALDAVGIASFFRRFLSLLRRPLAQLCGADVHSSVDIENADNGIFAEPIFKFIDPTFCQNGAIPRLATPIFSGARANFVFAHFIP